MLLLQCYCNIFCDTMYHKAIEKFTQENIDECVENECLNNSTCVDGVNKYTCDCPPGFTGDFCETDINECDAR